jgi:drug/metabolite transporter (DMT)-like permease
VALPSAHQVRSVTPQIAYLTIPGAFLAVLTWNAAIGLIGPQNAALFGNLIPVTTFAIEIGRGYRPGGGELGGAHSRLPPSSRTICSPAAHDR